MFYLKASFYPPEGNVLKSQTLPFLLLNRLIIYGYEDYDDDDYANF